MAEADAKGEAEASDEATSSTSMVSSDAPGHTTTRSTVREPF